MKILYIANIRIPTEKAHGLQIMKTCEALAAAGNEVELVVPTRRNTLNEDPFIYYQVRPIFKLTSIAVPDLVRFGKVGFLTSLVLFSERVRSLKNFWSADIIYSRDALVLLQYVLLGRPLVLEAHGKPSILARYVARRAHRVVVISKALGEMYERAGVAPEKIIIAPDAVDIRLFERVPAQSEVRTKLGLASGAKIVMYTGHLYARKGAETLARAATLVPEAQFVFVGGVARDVQSFRARWGSQNNIHIVGHVAPSLVSQYLHAADVLVIPNSSKDSDAREFTSPMKLFEYMAAGKPIVASDVPSIREVLSETAAVFVAPDDSVALAEGIRAVFNDSSRAHVLGQASKDLAKSHTWDARATTILSGIAALQ